MPIATEHFFHKKANRLSAIGLYWVGEKYNLIDARVAAQYDKGHIGTAQSIPHTKLRIAAKELDKDTVAVTYCNKGVTGNAAQNILINIGFKKVFNISGGYKQYRVKSKVE
jgi:rhodanese-related sulfurtransferase